MNPKTLTLIGGLTLVAALMGGCSLLRPDGSETAKDTLLPKLGPFGSGKIVEPKRCMLTVTMVSKPLHDKVVNESVWSTADEQGISSETRKALAANGIKIGVIEGSLPADLETVLNAPPPNKIEPVEFNIPEGDNTLLTLAKPTPEVTILLARRPSLRQRLQGSFRLVPRDRQPFRGHRRFAPARSRDPPRPCPKAIRRHARNGR